MTIKNHIPACEIIEKISTQILWTITKEKGKYAERQLAKTNLKNNKENIKITQELVPSQRISYTNMWHRRKNTLLSSTAMRDGLIR